MRFQNIDSIETHTSSQLLHLSLVLRAERIEFLLELPLRALRRTLVDLFTTRSCEAFEINQTRFTLQQFQFDERRGAYLLFFDVAFEVLQLTLEIATRLLVLGLVLVLDLETSVEIVDLGLETTTNALHLVLRLALLLERATQLDELLLERRLALLAQTARRRLRLVLLLELLRLQRRLHVITKQNKTVVHEVSSPGCSANKTFRF